MVRQLPIVLIEGKKYFLDERLQEYRGIENPHQRIAFHELGERKPLLPEQTKKRSKGKRL
jgi:hypothetical protein